MSTIFEDITEAYADGFDAEREVTAGEFAKLHFLKLDGGVFEFSAELTIDKGWSPDIDKPDIFKVARTDEAFNNVISDSEVSNVTITGSDNPALNNELFEINRDTTTPAGVNPFWKIGVTARGRKVSEGDILFYKSYVALLTQTGTDAPVATVLENALGGAVVWSRDGIGSYMGTLADAFAEDKTSVLITGQSGATTVGGRRLTDNTVSVNSYQADAPADDALADATIEIRVYV